MSENKTIKIKLIKSGIGRMKSHKLCIKGLGFKKLNQTRTTRSRRRGRRRADGPHGGGGSSEAGTALRGDRARPAPPRVVP